MKPCIIWKWYFFFCIMFISISFNVIFLLPFFTFKQNSSYPGRKFDLSYMFCSHVISKMTLTVWKGYMIQSIVASPLELLALLSYMYCTFYLSKELCIYIKCRLSPKVFRIPCVFVPYLSVVMGSLFFSFDYLKEIPCIVTQTSQIQTMISLRQWNTL